MCLYILYYHIQLLTLNTSGANVCIFTTPTSSTAIDLVVLGSHADQVPVEQTQAVMIH